MNAKSSIKSEVAEIINRWISKGDNDIAAIRIILDSGLDCPYDVACYHCEQAVERYLKALLTLHGIQAPRTHDIEHLHSLLPADRRLHVPVSDLGYLSAYGIDSWWDPDREQALRAQAIAIKLREQLMEALPPEFRRES